MIFRRNFRKNFWGISKKIYRCRRRILRESSRTNQIGIFGEFYDKLSEETLTDLLDELPELLKKKIQRIFTLKFLEKKSG